MPYITQQTFFDLSAWLATPQNYSKDQLARLKSEAGYLAIISLAHEYWLVGALTNQLKSVDVWDKIPHTLKSYLLEVEELYSNRLIAIKEETKYVSQLFTDANIDVVVMKGAASLFNGVALPSSNRYMKDIDLLVPEQLQQKAYDILIKNGYKKDNDYFDVNAKDAHHAPPLLKNNVCYIELHRWVNVKYLKKVLDTSDVWKDAIPLKLTQNLVIKQLTPTHQIILSIVHSEMQNGGFDQKHIDLHQLYNLFMIIKRFDNEIDWFIVRYHFENCHQSIVLTATLQSLFVLFNLNTPITHEKSKQGKEHFSQCLKNYVKRQGVNNNVSIVMEQLHGYKRRNIKLMYDKSGLIGYPIGLFQHAYYHLRKISSFPHIKLYFLRFMSKT